MNDLVIFGTGNFAKLAHHWFTTDSDYAVVGFAVDEAYLTERECRGLPVVPFEEVERRFSPDRCSMFVAAGIRDVNAFRARKVDEAEAKGYQLASYLSSRATYPAGTTVLPPNSMVMEGAQLMPGVTIGKNSILWPFSGLAIHVTIGDNCWIVAALMGEMVEIGDNTFVGLGANIAPKVKVGQSCVIGAGALILRDTGDNAVYRGAESKASKVPSARLRSLD